MELNDKFPVTPGGAAVTSCDLDDTCAELDCDDVLDELGKASLDNADGMDFLAHYCGLEYVKKLHGGEESEK
jgi:hypothetical protein